MIFFKAACRTTGLMLVSLALICGCASPDKGSDDGAGTGPAYDFPDDFLFGAATAGFQVDMGCPTLPPEVCDDTRSDWYQYVTTPELIASESTHLNGDDPSVVGPGHWELYESDLDLAANELNHNAFRMSIEWSRIFPESTTGVEGYENLRAIANDAAIEHYHDVFAALAERNLAPLVTIHHYTMPVWLIDVVGCHFDFDNCSPRGWLDTETAVHEIAKYAGFVAREFGGEVDLWGTQNEPFAVILPGFLMPTPERTNPPAVSMRTEATKTVFNALIEAHARMYDAVKENDAVDADGDGSPSMVGIIYAMAPAVPKNPDNELDRIAAENVFYLWNTAFLDAVSLGQLDENLDGNPQLRQDLAGRMDFLGINYKVRIVVEGLPTSVLPDLSPLATFNPVSLNIDDLYPKGIYDMCRLVQQRYGIPMYITENNGQSVPLGDMEAEIDNIVRNLIWLTYAIDDGIDVRGYFYWSLLDNYEWNHGMDIRLGLYAVDPVDPAKTRTERETVEVYSEIARTGAIPRQLAEQHYVERP